MVLLYNIRGRGLPPPISLRGVIYLSLTVAFLVEEKSLEDLPRSTAWSGSAVHVLITTFGGRPSGTGMNGLSRSYCHSSLAQKIIPRHLRLLLRYSLSHPPRSRLSRRFMARAVPSRSPITTS